jgi:hypothetical protein
LEKVTVPVTPAGTVSVIVSGVSMGRLDDDTTGGGSIGVFFPTDWVRLAVAELLLVSPMYMAVIVSFPVGRVEVEMVAAPLVIVEVPRRVDPLVKVTVPVTPDESEAVKVTD